MIIRLNINIWVRLFAFLWYECVHLTKLSNSPQQHMRSKEHVDISSALLFLIDPWFQKKKSPKQFKKISPKRFKKWSNTSTKARIWEQDNKQSWIVTTINSYDSPSTRQNKNKNQTT